MPAEAGIKANNTKLYYWVVFKNNFLKNNSFSSLSLLVNNFFLEKVVMPLPMELRRVKKNDCRRLSLGIRRRRLYWKNIRLYRRRFQQEEEL